MFTWDSGVHTPPRDYPLINSALTLCFVAKMGINAPTVQSLCVLSRVGDVSLQFESHQADPKVTGCMSPDPLVWVFTNTA